VALRYYLSVRGVAQWLGRQSLVGVI